MNYQMPIDEPQWYAVRTAVRAEKTAERELRLAGIECYLPEFKIERFNRRRRVNIITVLCLFPGYLFAQMRPGQVSVARACKGVSDMLPGFPHEPIALSRDAVRDVMDLRKAQADMLLDDTDEARRHRGETVKSTLAAMRKRLRGKTVRIRGGIFEGHTGTVQKVHSVERVRVLIKGLGREAPIDMAADQVEEVC